MLVRLVKWGVSGIGAGLYLCARGGLGGYTTDVYVDTPTHTVIDSSVKNWLCVSWSSVWYDSKTHPMINIQRWSIRPFEIFVNGEQRHRDELFLRPIKSSYDPPKLD